MKEKSDQVKRLDSLLNDGWEQRIITDENRLAEIVELYESLDFEVHLEPLTNDMIDDLGMECKSCYIDQWDNFKIIFTKKNLMEDL